MKTVEELEALLETVTRERDLSLSAWESAGMQGRTAQSAMLELARQLEAAQERIELLTELRDEERDLNEHFHQEIQAKHASAEQAKHERDEARDTIVALTTAMAEKDLEIATLTAALDERDLEAERSLEQYDSLMHQLADATNESTHFQVMCKRETEEVERLARQVELLTDERDELLVRVANQEAELRATREAYRDAYRRLCAPMWEEP
jgi:chromosome segregation ATPase